MKKISYQTLCWREEENVEKILRIISSIGYKGVELVESHFGQYFDKAKDLSKLVRSFGLEPVALAGGGNFTDPATYRREILGLKKMADFAAAADFDKIMIYGGPGTKREDGHFKMLAEAMNEVGEHAKGRGIGLTFHPHLGMMVEKKEHIDKFFNLVEQEKVGFCFDTAHLTGAGIDLPELIVEYGSRIDYVHLKDITDWGFVELGKGVVDFSSVFGAFDRIGYSGWFSVELDYTPNPEVSAGISWEHLKRIGIVK